MNKIRKGGWKQGYLLKIYSIWIKIILLNFSVRMNSESVVYRIDILIFTFKMKYNKLLLIQS